MKEPAHHYSIIQNNHSHFHTPLYPLHALPPSSSLKFSGKQDTINDLTEKIRILEDENRHLNETVNWMHETIWNLLQKNVINL